MAIFFESHFIPSWILLVFQVMSCVLHSMHLENECWCCCCCVFWGMMHEQLLSAMLLLLQYVRTHTQCDVRLNKTFVHHCYFSLHFLSIAPFTCVCVCVSPDICHTTSIVNNYFISAFGHLYMQPSEIMCKMCLAVVFCIAVCVTHRSPLFLYM